MVKNKAIIISYDLGLKGDYNALYAWLDSLKTLECGNSVGVFLRDFPDDNFNSIVDLLKTEISDKVKIEQTDRIYVFLKDEKGNMKGRFLFGARKRASWDGFAVKASENNDDIF